MPKEIAPGIHWIMELGPDRTEMIAGEGEPPAWYDPNETYHIPQCAYLLTGSEGTLLFDTLSPASTDEILTALDDVLGEDDLDYLVVSHPDVPHAGNAMAILEEHDGADLVAPGYGDDHELYRLNDARKVIEGDTIDLGDLTVEFHEAAQLDAPVSVWMSEQTTETLFPVDWLGFPLAASEAYRFADEMAGGMDIERLVQFHGRVLFWYQYVDVPKVQREFDHLIEKFDPNLIAPAHGLVIREEPTAVMRQMKDVVARVNEDGRVGILG